MGELTRKIENWEHYWNVCKTRPDLKEFKDLLHVNANMPYMKIGENLISTKDGTKTFNQLVKELAPKNDSEENNI